MAMEDIHLIKTNLENVNLQIEESYLKRGQNNADSKPLLVAVTKIKPVTAIQEAYSAGQRHFGENYIQELIEKSTDPNLLESCPDIKWHFIGRLQRKKIKALLSVPNLYMIQTVSSEEYARLLNNTWPLQQNKESKLIVLVQVNTSEEDQKNGVSIGDMINLYRFIKDECKNLELQGLMTIGKYYHDYLTGPNLDFIALIKCRTQICEEFGLLENDVELSMGMSNDFEVAIEIGSTIVRVGQAIFGKRITTLDP